ncbi:MAG: hypothetical protein QM754_02315 [Tepidisphaeraceae bacterium]
MPTPSIRRTAVIALGLLGLTSPAVFADDAKAMTVADMVAAVKPTLPATDGKDLAVESATMSQALNNKFAGQTINFDAGLIIQIITEGGGAKLVTFPPVDAEKSLGRSLGYAELKDSEVAAGKKLAPGDAARVSGKVVSVSAKVDVDSAGKKLTHVRVTMEDSSITGTTLRPRKKPANAAATQPTAE